MTHVSQKQSQCFQMCAAIACEMTDLKCICCLLNGLFKVCELLAKQPVRCGVLFAKQPAKQPVNRFLNGLLGVCAYCLLTAC